MTVFFALLSVVLLALVLRLGLAPLDPGRKRVRFPIVFRQTDTHLIIGWRSLIERPAVIVPEPLRADWRHVRAMELDVYGRYFHTRTGQCLKAGVTPEEETEQDKLAAQRASVADYLAKIKRATEIRELEQPSLVVQAAPSYYATRTATAPCFCNYCRGRAGVHGEDARALYRAQSEHALRVADLRRKAAIIAEGIADEDDLTPQKIRDMPMKDYAALRARATASRQPGGLFYPGDSVLYR